MHLLDTFKNLVVGNLQFWTKTTLRLFTRIENGHAELNIYDLKKTSIQLHWNSLDS